MPSGVYIRTEYHKEIYRLRGLRFRGNNHPLWKGNVNCIDCNKPLIHRRIGIKRCRKCNTLYKVGNRHQNWKGGLNIKKCLYCNKEFKIYPYREKTAQFCSLKCRAYYLFPNGVFYGRKHSIESRKKMSFKKIGKYCKENSPNWRGGKSFQEYGKEFDSPLKEQVRFKDNYKCQVCGCSQIENGQQLDIHHIDYNKKNNILENLISLCVSCHRKTNFNREYWKMVLDSYREIIYQLCKNEKE